MPLGRNDSPVVVPYSSLDDAMLGNAARGTSKSATSSGSHAHVESDIKSVRDALVASVTCTMPPVSRCTSQVSMVPNSARPRSALARAPVTLSRSQRILVPEKYGSSTRPVFALTMAS